MQQIQAVLQHGGPNHLGLCLCGLSSNMMYLITSDCGSTQAAAAALLGAAARKHSDAGFLGNGQLRSMRQTCTALQAR